MEKFVNYLLNLSNFLIIKTAATGGSPPLNARTVERLRLALRPLLWNRLQHPAPFNSQLTEPVFVNVYVAQESILRNRFRKPM
jgi:hypothetical protein